MNTINGIKTIAGLNMFLTGLVGTLSEVLSHENILSLWTVYRDNVKVRHKVSGHSARETEDIVDLLVSCSVSMLPSLKA